jgi:hypothetical protein
MSVSDVIDRIAVLQIKRKYLPNVGAAIEREIRELNAEEIRLIRCRDDVFVLECELVALHEQAWLSNEIIYGSLDRDCDEAERDEVFHAIQRSARLNVKRIELKNEIERVLGTGVREEKSFNQEAAHG